MRRFQRIIKILLHLQSGPRFNTAQLSATFKVSRRTIYRDLAFLKDAGLPILFDEANESYKLDSDQFPSLPKVLNVENLEMLLVAAKASPAYCVPVMATKIDAAISDILSPLPLDVRNRVSALMNGFAASFHVCDLPDPDEVIWATMLKAIESHLKVDVSIQQSGKSICKKISPYQIVASDVGWCVLGRSSVDRGSQAFRLSDIESAELTNDTYRTPRGFRRIGPQTLSKTA